MTAIIVYRKDKNTIFVAADKRHNHDYGMYFDNAMKYWAHNGVWIFTGGNAAVGQAVKGLTFERKEEMIQAVLYQEVLPKLRQAVEETKIEKPDFVFIVIIDGMIWLINEQFYANEIAGDFINIGAGGDFAEGYLRGLLEGYGTATERKEGFIEHLMRISMEETSRRFRNVSPTCDILRIETNE